MLVSLSERGHDSEKVAMRRWLLLSIAFGWAFQVSPAIADELPRVKISFADLNLDHREGTRSLYRQIKHAAEKVCGLSDRSRKPLSRADANGDCLRAAIDTAVAKVNRPLVTQYAQERTAGTRRAATVARE
jgi:UrcA family protein